MMPFRYSTGQSARLMGWLMRSAGRCWNLTVMCAAFSRCCLIWGRGLVCRAWSMMMAAPNMLIMATILLIMSASRGLARWLDSAVKLATLKGAVCRIRDSLMPTSRTVAFGIRIFRQRPNITKWRIWTIRNLPSRWGFMIARSPMPFRFIRKCYRNSGWLPKVMVMCSHRIICGSASNNVLPPCQAGIRHLKAPRLTRTAIQSMR